MWVLNIVVAYNVYLVFGSCKKCANHSSLQNKKVNAILQRSGNVAKQGEAELL